MSILYAMVARGSVVLAEYSSSSSNANAVARQILEKLPSSADTRVSYSQDRFIFHVTKAEGITYLCMANDTFGSKSSYPILLNLKKGISSRCSFDYRFHVISIF
jgi:vesicle-associated membrane protein 7